MKIQTLDEEENWEVTNLLINSSSRINSSFLKVEFKKYMCNQKEAKLEKGAQHIRDLKNRPYNFCVCFMWCK